MGKIVITGGAGFAGSHIVDRFRLEYPDDEIVVLDRMTYAGDVRNLKSHIIADTVQLAVGDVADLDCCLRVVEGARLVVHAAAESHVDNSFGNSREFTRTNVLGTHCLVEACRVHNVPRFIHISTDEVYGDVIEGSASEDAVLSPTNPYSASKAAAEMIIQGYIRSFKAPIVIVRANNLFGTRQYPEKIVPRFVCQMLLDRKMTLHGTGMSKRHYLSALDFADAIVLVAERGRVGEIYNIGTTEEYTNIEVAEMIASAFGRNLVDMIEFVPDRPFNDSRYCVSWDKMRNLGWMPQLRLADHLPDVIEWFHNNLDHYASHFKFQASPRRIPADRHPVHAA